MTGRKRALLAAWAALGPCLAGPLTAQPAGRTAIDWEHAPRTPGSWTYRSGPQAAATFGRLGADDFEIRCVARGQIQLQRTRAAADAITFRSSSTVRTVPAARAASGALVRLPAGDALLDALAFSRGRFLVEAAGAPPIIVPAWPELARVVEDCRR